MAPNNEIYGIPRNSSSSVVISRSDESLGEMASSYREIIKNLGEDPDREGLRDTPMRAAKVREKQRGKYVQNCRKLCIKKEVEENHA